MRLVLKSVILTLLLLVTKISSSTEQTQETPNETESLTSQPISETPSKPQVRYSKTTEEKKAKLSACSFLARSRMNKDEVL